MFGELLTHLKDVTEDQWVTFPEYGFRQYFFWKHPTTGASIAVLEFEEKGGVPVKHSHASNQFMYCLEGEYEYTERNLILTSGSFYMNPKDNPHGPTVARKWSRLIEVYDGPHYYDRPAFHSEATIGDDLLAKK